MSGSSTIHTVSQMYESLLFDMSYDLHERYTQLLTSALHRVDIEENNGELKLLITHLIDEMRNRSNEIYPLLFHEYGLEVAFKKYVKQVAKRYGIKVSFPNSNSLSQLLTEPDVLTFRLLQLTLKMIVEHAEPDQLSIEVEKECILFRYQSYIQEFPSDQQELLGLLKKGLNMEMSVSRIRDIVEWRWFTCPVEGGVR